MLEQGISISVLPNPKDNGHCSNAGKMVPLSVLRDVAPARTWGYTTSETEIAIIYYAVSNTRWVTSYVGALIMELY